MDCRVKPGNDGRESPTQFLARDLFVEVTPIGIHRDDEINLPLTWPVPHVLFTLDCSQRGIVALVIDQHLDRVASGEPRHGSFPMLKNTAHQIVRDADVEGAARRLARM